MPIYDVIDQSSRQVFSRQLSSSASTSSFLPGEILNVVTGDSGDNLLTGSTLNDEITAGDGDDILIGNGGADYLSGGAGADRFRFNLGQSNITHTATISDFIVGYWSDSVELRELAGYNFSQLADTFSTLEAGLSAVRSLPANQLVVFTVMGDITHSYIYAAAQGDTAETLIQLSDHDGRYLSLHMGSIRTLLEGGTDTDVITHNGSLDSYIDAGAGDDYIYGGSQFDHIIAGAGNDRLDGRAGQDLLDTTAATAIINDSGHTLTVNGITVTTGTSVGATAQATEIIGQDQLSNIEWVITSDQADYIAFGDTLRNADAGAGNDVLLDDPDSWSNAYGGSGQDSFVFISAENISSNSTDLLGDFNASEDKLIFVTDGHYQIADQIYQPDASLNNISEIEAQIRSDSTLSDQLVFFRYYETCWLFINGNGGVSGASLNNTVIQLPVSNLYDMAALSAAISFSTEIPSTTTPPDVPTTPDEVLKVFDEPDTGSIDNYFLLSTNRTASEAMTLWYETAGGTATAGSDYEAVSGWVTIDAGQKSAAIAVKIYGDMIVEQDETIQLQISDPSGQWLKNGVTLIAEHTVMDNDLASIQ